MIIDTLLNPKDESHLAAALELFRMKDAVRAQLQRKLMQAVESSLAAGWLIHLDLVKNGILGLKTARDTSWHFRVEGEGRGSGIRHWWYGLRHDEGATKTQRLEVEDLCASLRGRLPEGGPPVPGYTPFWRWFDGLGEHEPKEYLDWDASIIPWLDVYNRIMAAHFINLAQQLDLRELQP